MLAGSESGQRHGDGHQASLVADSGHVLGQVVAGLAAVHGQAHVAPHAQLLGVECGVVGGADIECRLGAHSGVGRKLLFVVQEHGLDDGTLMVGHRHRGVVIGLAQLAVESVDHLISAVLVCIDRHHHRMAGHLVLVVGHCASILWHHHTAAELASHHATGDLHQLLARVVECHGVASMRTRALHIFQACAFDVIDGDGGVAVKGRVDLVGIALLHDLCLDGDLLQWSRTDSPSRVQLDAIDGCDVE